MKLNELLEGRHPHDQYYRAKPKSQFKWKPRPKKTLWYNGDQFDNWSADIRTRFSDATAYYDEENEEVIASSADMKKSYGRWRKKDKDGRNGVSYYKPRPLDTVTHGRHRLRPVTEGFGMKLKDILEDNEQLELLDDDTEGEMIIRYAETYQIVTPESAEFGEAEDQGFIDDDIESDYEDMVSLLQGTEPSSFPPDETSWYTATDYDEDFQTGGKESRSYHGKSDKDQALMFKAWQEAN